jgi:hypothetical protein
MGLSPSVGATDRQDGDRIVALPDQLAAIQLYQTLVRPAPRPEGAVVAREE